MILKLLPILILISGLCFADCKEPLSGTAGKTDAPAKKEPRVIDSGWGVQKVSARGGLRMRVAPQIESRVVGLIPDGAMVNTGKYVFESITLGDQKGHWVYIEYYGQIERGRPMKKQSGWVFNAVLKDPEPPTIPKIDATFQSGCLGKQCDKSDPFSEEYVISLSPKGAFLITREHDTETSDDMMHYWTPHGWAYLKK